MTKKGKGSRRNLRRLIREAKHSGETTVDIKNLVAKHSHKINKNKVIQNKVQKELEKLADEELMLARRGIDWDVLPDESCDEVPSSGTEGSEEE